MDGGPLLQAKRAGLLWLAGFTQACCLHRVVHFCRSSRKLLIRTGQCFLLNGLIFLGSLLFLYKVVIPALLWILPEQCKELGFQDLCASGAVMRFYSFLHYTLINLFYIFWFYPLYVFSLILSTMWYSDIAKMAFERSALQLEEPTKKNEVPNLKSAVPVDKPAGFEGVIIGIGEQVYSALLLTIFYIEVIAIGYIPFIGKFINFLLLSWIYAYYCFEYKWNLSELSLDRRLNFFELNWAFFAGFGSPCVLAIFFFSPLISYGVMSILFPLFCATTYVDHEKWLMPAGGLYMASHADGAHVPLWWWDPHCCSAVRVGTRWMLALGGYKVVLLNHWLISSVLKWSWGQFVLTATGTNEQEVISSQRRSWRAEGPRKLPIFYAANILSMKLLQLFPEVDNKVR